MLKRILAAFFVLALTLSFSLATFAQDAMKQEAKKEEKKPDMPKTDMSKMDMTKAEKAMGPLKTLSCDETCGFMIRSRDEKEVMAAMKAHAKKVHSMTMTAKDMKDKMKVMDEMKH
ncbi:MAG TPA: DUF1059 domain-containing protein [Bacteroidota bacterium]|jgi:pentapeptide MXKDX repeat protein|nr:DUF1059 domain-containing protein [Bacteroidota bacterium]